MSDPTKERTMKRILTALFGILVFAPGLLVAHDGEDHMKHNKVMGTVAVVDAEKGRLEVKMKDGKSAVVSLDKNTKVMKGEKPGAIADVAVGSKVVVTTMDHSGMTMAMEIHLPAAKGDPAPAK
jgi:hypothetical protein